LAAALVAVLNLVRAGRPEDRTLAWITFCGSLCWVAVAIAFGASIGNVIDPRAVWHALSAFVLAGLSFRTAIGRSAANE
jgi:membrane protein DedA with SNARE-associated domain